MQPRKFVYDKGREILIFCHWLWDCVLDCGLMNIPTPSSYGCFDDGMFVKH